MQISPSQQLILDAISATDSFAEVLSAERMTDWSDRLSAIAAFLRQGDVKSATHFYNVASHAGHGSLADVITSDDAAYNQAWGAWAASLRALGKP